MFKYDLETCVMSTHDNKVILDIDIPRIKTEGTVVIVELDNDLNIINVAYYNERIGEERKYNPNKKEMKCLEEIISHHIMRCPECNELLMQSLFGIVCENCGTNCMEMLLKEAGINC